MPTRQYTREYNVFSPQRTAGLGRRAQLPEQYALSYRGTTPQEIMQQIQRMQQPQTTFNETLMPNVPLAEEMTFGGGPGVGAFGGEATANPSAVDTGLISPETGRTAEQIASLVIFGNTKGVPTPSSIFGFIPAPLAQKGLSTLAKGTKEGISYLNEQLGDPWGKAKDAFVNALGLGEGESVNLGFQGMSMPDSSMIGQQSIDPNLGQDPFGLEANSPMSHGEPDMGPPPSSLADIGIGGAPSSGDIGSGFAIGTGEYGGYEGAMGGFGGIGASGGGYGGAGFGFGGYGEGY